MRALTLLKIPRALCSGDLLRIKGQLFALLRGGLLRDWTLSSNLANYFLRGGLLSGWTLHSFLSWGLFLHGHNDSLSFLVSSLILEDESKLVVMTFRERAS